MPDNINPETTAYFRDARDRGVTRYGRYDADAYGLLDVLLEYLEDLHSGANIGLDDIKGLLSDLDDVTRFLRNLIYQHLLAQRVGLSVDEV